MEEWRVVKGYEGLYEVSNTGKVLSLYRYRKELKPMKVRNGYLRVDLFNDKGRKQYSIHRLVAAAFIDNPDNLPQVNHKDENKENNHVDNLEWCSCEYNTWYGNNAPIKKMCEAKRKSVAQYSMDGSLVKVYASARAAARETGIGQSSISNCCNNRRGYSQSGGYVWRFE